ncbi:MAG: phosphate-starvation-inducible PsiE family protein [Methanomicrobiaceae archaeon]|nr:phosphate-starvation-inducible PsiE family protein [Methanomicrobiaceae archaeon]
MTALDRLNQFERGVYYILIALFSIVILFAVMEMAILVVQTIADVTSYRMDSEEILHLFGFLLLILIGLELLDTIKVYMQENRIHVEAILLVAIIAIARKVILFDPFEEGVGEIPIIGMAAIVIALCGGYYLIKKAGYS